MPCQVCVGLNDGNIPQTIRKERLSFQTVPQRGTHPGPLGRVPRKNTSLRRQAKSMSESGHTFFLKEETGLRCKGQIIIIIKK